MRDYDYIENPVNGALVEMLTAQQEQSYFSRGGEIKHDNQGLL